MSSACVGFIGIGSIGAPMARHLVEQGQDVVVCDVSSSAVDALVAAGATSAASPRQVADKAEVIFTCLPSNESCDVVAFGPDGLVHGNAVRVFANLGTTGSQFARDLADRLAERSIAMLDAPVSGGAQGAAKGTLAVMVSGPHATFLEVEPVLKRIGSNVTYVGERAGLAQTLKVINSLLSATAIAVTGEAMVMGVKAGLDPEIMIKVLNDGTGRNSATADKFPRAILTRTFSNNSAMSISAKDNKLYVAEAEALGVPMWIAHTVHQLFTYALARGGGEQDRLNIVKYMEEWAGVEIPKTR